YPRTVSSFMRRQIWQTSDYLRTLNGKIDKTFILTSVFLIALLYFALSLITGDMFFSLFSFSLMIIVSAFTAIFRYVRSAEAVSLSLFLKVATLYFCYYLARSIGLVFSFFRLLFRKGV